MDEQLRFESLLAGARRFTDLAMAARARPDHELFALHAGVAVERLTKAVLARKSSVLLLDMRSGVEMLFHLTGVKDAQIVRTISMTEAISRLRRLDVLPRVDAKLDLLVAMRNGIAHSDGAEVSEDLMPVFARTIDSLLNYLGEDRDEFLGTWRETVTIAVEGALSDLERDVHLRIQNARYLFNARASQLPKDFLIDHLDSAPQGKWHIEMTKIGPGMFLAMMVDCPACGGGPKVNMAMTDRFGEDKDVVVADRFVCPFCHLALNTAEELELAGISSTIDADECKNERVADLVRTFVKEERYMKKFFEALLVRKDSAPASDDGSSD